MRACLVATLLTLAASPAAACTTCHSDLAEQVRAGVLSGGLDVAAAVSAPAVVLAGTIALLARWAR